MALEERIQKLEMEKEKLEEKKEKIIERLREISVKLERTRQELKNQKNEKLASVIEKNIGELSEEKIKILDGILREQTEKFLQEEDGQKENFESMHADRAENNSHPESVKQESRDLSGQYGY